MRIVSHIHDKQIHHRYRDRRLKELEQQRNKGGEMNIQFAGYSIRGNKGDYTLSRSAVSEETGESYDADMSYHGNLYQALSKLKGILISEADISTIQELIDIEHKYGKELKELTVKLEKK